MQGVQKSLQFKMERNEHNTPAIIKYPFGRMTAVNPKATYVCVNQGEIDCPREIENQSILFDADVGKILCDLRRDNI